MKATTRSRSFATTEKDNPPAPSNRALMNSNSDSTFSSRNSSFSSTLDSMNSNASQRGSPPSSLNSFGSSASSAPSRKSGASLTRTSSSPSTVLSKLLFMNFKTSTFREVTRAFIVNSFLSSTNHVCGIQIIIHFEACDVTGWYG